MTLPDGLYDQLLTDALRDAVMRTTDEHAHSLQPLTAEDAPERLADALAAQLSRILDDLNGDGFITQMRVKDPEGRMIPSKADARIMVPAMLRKANAANLRCMPKVSTTTETA